MAEPEAPKHETTLDTGKQQVGEVYAASLLNAADAAGETLEATDDLLSFLPHGSQHDAAQKMDAWLAGNESIAAALSVKNASILTPIPKPNKLLLLAGNYAKQIALTH